MTFEEILHAYRSVYYSFPQPLKTFLGSLYGSIPLEIRFGRQFGIHKKLLEKFENGDEQYKQDYIYNKILETLIFAETYIPYYQKKFKEHGVSSRDFKALEDIGKFPTISKLEMKEHLDELYTDVRYKPVAHYTGGSLTTPTKFYLAANSRAKEKVYNNYIFTKIGYKYRTPTLLLKGREISVPEKDIYWEYEPIDNYFLLSNNYLNSEKFPLMYEKAKAFGPKFIFGYPSAVLSFIKMSRRFGLEPLPNIEGIILASETCYPDEVEIIKEFFPKAKVLSLYGNSERDVIGYRVSDHYNLLGSYAAMRVVDGEIVTTSFDNFVMPFINRRSGDYATGEVTTYGSSDIAKTVGNIEGRTKDFLVSEDNRLVSITTMCGGQHLPLMDIDAIQYIQEEPGVVTVLVEDPDHRVDVVKVKEGMHKLVRDGIDFKVKVVDKIDKTYRGKRIICKQFLDVEKIRAQKERQESA
ncbi:hypothetical protein [Hydrogenimonas sp.]